jgi:hypothetical protein
VNASEKEQIKQLYVRLVQQRMKLKSLMIWDTSSRPSGVRQCLGPFWQKTVENANPKTENNMAL